MNNEENQNSIRQREGQSPQEHRSIRRRLESQLEAAQDYSGAREEASGLGNNIAPQAQSNIFLGVPINNEAVQLPNLDTNIDDEQVENRFQNAVRIARRNIDQRAMAAPQDIQVSDSQELIETQSPTSVTFLNRSQNNMGGGRGL